VDFEQAVVALEVHGHAVLFNPKHGVPVDFEGDNRLFVIPVADIVAVFRAADEAKG